MLVTRSYNARDEYTKEIKQFDLNHNVSVSDKVTKWFISSAVHLVL